MKSKVLILVICIASIFFGASFSEEMKKYDLSIYVGKQVSLKNDLASVEPDFLWDENTVVQNLNAAILTVRYGYIATADDNGYAALVISNGSKQVMLNYEIISPIEGISIENEYLTLLLGEIYDLDYDIVTVNDYELSAKDVKWVSSNVRVATIVNANEVQTHAVGDTVITAMNLNGQELGKIDLTVLGHSEKLKIKSSVNSNQINVGEELQLNAYFGSKDITNSVNWISETPHILEVNENGLIRAIGEGRGIIRAQTSISNKKESYTINSYSMIDKVSLSKTYLKFDGIGQTHQLTFNLYPKDKSYPPILKGFRYTSSNPEVATVTQSGQVTAISPGIALISVIFDDSQKKGTCTVEVPSTGIYIENGYTPVKNISVVPSKNVALIGEKILISTTVSPSTATNKDVNFNIPNGDNNQVKFINGSYYFIPTKRGNVKIEVSTLDGPKDEFSIVVTSPIESIDLSLSTRRIIGTNREKIFIGEKVEVLTRVFSRDGYSVKDVYDASLIYKVNNENLAEIIHEDNKIFIRGLKSGKIELEVENLEGLHNETLWIEVEDPIATVSSDTEVTLPTNQVYRPRIYYQTNDTRYNLDQSFDIYKLVEYEVTSIQLEESFIDDEIQYETSMVNYYLNQPYDLSVRDAQEEHQNRLDLLLSYKLNAINGYVTLVDNKKLKDRNGISYKYYEVSKGGINSKYPIKMSLKLSIKGTPHKTETRITYNNNGDFRIDRLGNIYKLDALIDQYSLGSLLVSLPIDRQVELLVTYINYSEIFERIPTYDVLKSISLIKNDSVLSEIKIDKLDHVLSKEDLAKISVVLHKKYVNRHIEENTIDNPYYYDVLDKELNQAIALGYVPPYNDDFFGTDRVIVWNEYKAVINSILPGYYSNTSNNKEMTYEMLILELGKLFN